ncbi:hypothetical protein GGR54DRAFT_618412 [Hypoxylon sp. NC1633]|nr:hypothetical protein GGR54DRAFT_618412 [Hypoxylon sp. NC1633]
MDRPQYMFTHHGYHEFDDATDEAYDEVDDEVDDDADDPSSAPILEIAQKKILAIEHPCVLLNLDKGLATFGQEPGFHKLLADTRETGSIPLWFRPENPTSKPIVSHNTATNNVLLKITVPKRTGRKRKRGTDDPFTGVGDVAKATDVTSNVDQISSVGRHDMPKSILRKMQDNVDDYLVEAVGSVKNTHRYRGLADFQFANTSPSFLSNAAEHLLPMKVSKLREIRFAPGVAASPGQEIIPPPHFTDKVLGFNYHYEQNPNIKVEGGGTGEEQVVNIQGRKMNSIGHFINHNTYPVPQKPYREPSMQVPRELLSQLQALMEERPIWTRRAILNRVIGDYTDTGIKVALQLVGYQFRGGPWRDAFVKYGVDPRQDPKFRSYQTLAFKLERNIVGLKKIPWEVIRKDQFRKRTAQNRTSHLWNGKAYYTDGKFWQVCDITDPFVRGMLDQAPLRTECDPSESGWYYKSTWSKVKVVMKVKMIAISRGRMGSDDDHPQKQGFIYNSFLNERLRSWPGTFDRSLNFSMEPFLRPMEELDSRVRRPRAEKRPKQKAHEGVRTETQSNTDGDKLGNIDDENGEMGSGDEDAPLQVPSWEDDENIEDDVEDDIDDGIGDEEGDPEEYYEDYDIDEEGEDEQGGEGDEGHGVDEEDGGTTMDNQP